MYCDSIEFNGRLYKTRIIDFGEDWGVFKVASRHLDHLLVDKRGSYTTEDARFVDEQIFYFIAPARFRLSDKRLKDRILWEIDD